MIRRLIRSLLFRALHLWRNSCQFLSNRKEYFRQVRLYAVCQCLSLFRPINDRDISWYVVSLNRGDRRRWVANLSEKIPSLEIWEAVDGYNPAATMAAFGQSGLTFHGWLKEWCGKDFNRYGKLACFLSRYYLLLHQVNLERPFVVFLEDDIHVDASFAGFAKSACQLFELYPSLNIIRLGRLGEGYITSLDGARRIIHLIQATGIIDHSDMQLRKNCGPEISLARLKPVGNLVEANCGDIGQTPRFSEEDLRRLQSKVP